MNALQRAVRQTVHEFRFGSHRGAAAAAQVLGIRPRTCANKVNPNQRHEFTLRESIALQQASGRFDILIAYAAELDFLAIPMPPEIRGCTDLELLDLYAQWHSDIGAKCSAIRESLSDGIVTDDESNTVHELSLQASSTGLALSYRMRQLATTTEDQT